MQLALTKEQSILQKIYDRPDDMVKSFLTIQKGHKILRISDHQLQGPLLIMPPNKRFLKNDWLAIGEKMGFLQEKEGNEEEMNDADWLKVTEVRLEASGFGCSLTCCKNKE